MNWATERLDQLKAGTVELPPVVATLKLGGLDDWSPGRVVKRWSPTNDVLQVDGTMFGGHIAALADQIMAFAAMSVVPEGFAFRTVNLTVQFFKLGRDHPLTIEARVTAQTRSLISIEADFRRDDDVLLARAAAQQMIVPFPSAR